MNLVKSVSTTGARERKFNEVTPSFRVIRGGKNISRSKPKPNRKPGGEGYAALAFGVALIKEAVQMLEVGEGDVDISSQLEELRKIEHRLAAY